MIIYRYDSNGYFTGKTRELAPKSPIPPGWTHKKPTGVEGERFVGNVWQVVGPPPPPVDNSFTYKSDIWERCTEDEAEILDSALALASAKKRRMFTDAIKIEHSSEYFGVLKSEIAELLDEQRATEILAPSAE